LSDNSVHKLVIIGLRARRLDRRDLRGAAQLDPIVYVGVPKQDPGPVLPGGQLMLTTDVENYPGLPRGRRPARDDDDVPEAGRALRHRGHRTQDIDAVRVLRPVNAAARAAHVEGRAPVRAHSVIISTGATANWMGLENELRLAQIGGGVSACAVCDGALPLFRDQPSPSSAVATPRWRRRRTSRSSPAR
jgi:thioredoxin reductase (NADPH)